MEAQSRRGFGRAFFLCPPADKLERMFGFLNVHKPAGPTSHDIVAMARRTLGRKKVKVGHCGTLDPFADGVLVLCFGPATRLAEFVSDMPKQYRAEVTFGVVSGTDDPEGELTPTGRALPAAEAIREALPAFLGHIEQTPPSHSAVQIGGLRAYQLARAGQDVGLSARNVRIDAIELLAYADGRARLEIECGGGTYIRALARDLGERLGCGAYCSGLTRTRTGPFVLADALALKALTPAVMAAHLQPARLAVQDWPTITVSPEQERAIRLGKFLVSGFATAPPPGRLAAVNAAGDLVALCDHDPQAGRVQPVKVFNVETASSASGQQL